MNELGMGVVIKRKWRRAASSCNAFAIATLFDVPVLEQVTPHCKTLFSVCDCAVQNSVIRRIENTIIQNTLLFYDCFGISTSVNISIMHCIRCCQSGMFNGDCDAAMALLRWWTMPVKDCPAFCRKQRRAPRRLITAGRRTDGRTGEEASWVRDAQATQLR